MRYVGPGGTFAIALYRKTPLCRAWTLEKKFYANRRLLRPFVRYPFAAALLLAHFLKGRNPVSYVRNYGAQRGMSFMHDVDDWLGGYPYESVEPDELVAFFEKHGFRPVLEMNTESHIGLFGTGCGEWVFQRTGEANKEPAAW